MDDLLEQVTTGTGNFKDLDQSLRKAFKSGRRKYVKYFKKLEKNALIYAAHILNPRYRGAMIKNMMPD